MNDIQNINPNLSAAIAAQTAQTEQPKTAAPLEPLLSGASVTVTQAPSSDLEKLVARIKNENDEMKAALAKRRLASVLDAYAERYGEISEQQALILEEITNNNDDIAQAMADLKEALADLDAAKGQWSVMQAKIEALERAVAQAVEDGKIHRENVAKLKEQLAEDRDNEELKAELAKEEKAVETADAALARNQAELAIAQVEAGSLSAKIESFAGKAETLSTEIEALEASNASLAAQLGSQTVSNLLAALEKTEPATAAVERNVSAAEEEKVEKKAIANDPANVLREAMDRMDAAILRTIDENRDKTV